MRNEAAIEILVIVGGSGAKCLKWRAEDDMPLEEDDEEENWAFPYKRDEPSRI